MAAEGSAGLTGTCLCHSLCSERGSLGGPWGGRQPWGHLAILSRLLLSALLGRPGPYVPEDLHNEQVDGEHEEGALKANHHFLPCELDLTCQGQTEERRKNNPRQNKPSSLSREKTHLFNSCFQILLSLYLPAQAMVRMVTQIHFLLSRVLWHPPEHDAGEHGAQEQGEAAGHTLGSREGASWGAAENGVPDVPILETLGGPHEKQIAGKEKGKSKGCVERRGKNKALVQGPSLFMHLGTISRSNNQEKLSNIVA